MGIMLMLPLRQIPVIQNGTHLKAQKQTLVFEEDLRLGPANLPEEHLFVGVNVSVDADAAGNIYIADGASNRVLVFSPEGGFLRQIGRAGEGPGEFLALRRFEVLTQGGALAFEGMQHLSRINWFDTQYKFARVSQRNNRIHRIKDWRGSPDGQTFACELVRIDTVSKRLVTRFLLTDGALNEQAEFGHFSQEEFDTTRVRDQSYWVTYLAAFFVRELKGQRGYFSFRLDNGVYTAMGGAYEVTQWNAQAMPIRKIVRRVRPVLLDEASRRAAVAFEHERLLSELPPDLHQVVTLAVVERAFRDAKLPQVKPPIYGLLAMEKGFIVVGDQKMGSGTCRGDLFSEEGAFLGSFSHELLSLRNMVFKNGFAYTIGRDSEGENVMVRWRPSLRDIK